MNIVQENVDELNAVLKINLSPEDYKEKYDAALKSYKKQMSVPGFRPGHVPMGLVKKQYGKSLLAEQINSVLSESIQKHITENKLNVLGNPLPKETEAAEGDWDNPGDFNFEYEMGLAPDIVVDLDKKKSNYYVIKVDDKLIDKQADDMAKRFGKLSEPEKSGDSDLLMGTFVELDEDGNIAEGGIMNDATVSIEFVDDKKTKKSLVGKKKGDLVVVDPNKVSRGHDDLEKMLGITHEQVHNLKGNFNFTINEIKRLEATEINQDLFDKVFGPGIVKSEEEFRTKISADLSQNFVRDQDWMFQRELTEELLKKLNPALPDTFMKKWISASNENDLSAEQLEAEYPQYAKGLQWQLIENQIIRDNDIKVSYEDVLNYAKQNIAQQYAQYGMPMEEEDLNKYAANALSNREEYGKISENLYREEVLKVCKDKVKTKEKEVSYDDFVKMVEKMK